MSPSKVLREYLMDVEDQYQISLRNKAEEESKEIEKVVKDFKAAINLIEFYTREGIELQNLIKNGRV